MDLSMTDLTGTVTNTNGERLYQGHIKWMVETGRKFTA